MTKDFVSLVVDEGVLRVMMIRAARAEKSESQVIEEALRRDFDTMEEIWSKVRNPLPEEEAMKLAYSELKAMRQEQRAAGGP